MALDGVKLTLIVRGYDAYQYSNIMFRKPKGVPHALCRWIGSLQTISSTTQRGPEKVWKQKQLEKIVDIRAAHEAEWLGYLRLLIEVSLP